MISIQVLFTSDNSILGNEEMTFTHENNFLMPQKQIIICKQDPSQHQKQRDVLVIKDLEIFSFGHHNDSAFFHRKC